MDIIRRYIENIAKLSDEEWHAFEQILTVKEFAKKDRFLKQGQISNYSAFIAKGIFRMFTTDNEGNEKIVQFNSENSFLADCESYLNQNPTEYNIEAIENSTLVVFKNKELESLCHKHPIFEKIGRHVTHEILSYYKEHLKIVMTNSPQERYEHILANRSELIQRVSVTFLAQFLGLTRETVSRLRSKVATI